MVPSVEQKKVFKCPPQDAVSLEYVIIFIRNLEQLLCKISESMKSRESQLMNSVYRDPFTLPMLSNEKKRATAAKFELASLYGGHSDQLAVIAAFECWRMQRTGVKKHGFVHNSSSLRAP
ncbi:hypothetical protein OIU78_012548 [Salix suchowensis]|nr:hypothetical protein OIU78_012548 [Salix suchowensis]